LDFGLGRRLIQDSEDSKAFGSALVTAYSSLFFAYGTLRRGFCRHQFLNAPRAQLLSRGTVCGELHDLGAYPGAIPSENKSALVRGEVFRLLYPARALQVLDFVEGIVQGSPEHNLYRRELASVTLENGTKVGTWIYWLNRMHMPKRRILSGEYSKNAG